MYGRYVTFAVASKFEDLRWIALTQAKEYFQSMIFSKCDIDGMKLLRTQLKLQDRDDHILINLRDRITGGYLIHSHLSLTETAYLVVSLSTFKFNLVNNPIFLVHRTLLRILRGFPGNTSSKFRRVTGASLAVDYCKSRGNGEISA